MRTGERLDALDTRMVFFCYAIVAGVAGVLLIAWGPMWFGAHLPGLTCGKAALIRIAGAFPVATACFAVAMARVDDAVARRRGLLWFAFGHFFVGAILGIQRAAILGQW